MAEITRHPGQHAPEAAASLPLGYHHGHASTAASRVEVFGTAAGGALLLVVLVAVLLRMGLAQAHEGPPDGERYKFEGGQWDEEAQPLLVPGSPFSRSPLSSSRGRGGNDGDSGDGSSGLSPSTAFLSPAGGRRSPGSVVEVGNAGTDWNPGWGFSPSDHRLRRTSLAPTDDWRQAASRRTSLAPSDYSQRRTTSISSLAESMMGEFSNMRRRSEARKAWSRERQEGMERRRKSAFLKHPDRSLDLEEQS